ncbi:uncharacterized protein LOC141614668 [Silene latifolia]|uniref:uncharacterized protein LOC141614668 n=1 Tax=Silene latifolia TaxID=37657 RepID=UPI003D788644
MPESVNNSDDSPYAFFDDPLFLSTNDQPCLKLIDYKFNGKNFLNWKRDTYVALISKNKEGFIDGSVKKPDISDKKYHQWMRCDILVRQWMRNSMDDDIKENMSYANSSKDLWDEMIERYDDVNAIEIYQFRKDLNVISQGNTPLIEYYGNLKRTWKNLDTLDLIPTCTCGALSAYTCQLLKRIIDRDTHTKLIQFLMGLNSGYEGVKTNILSMEPLPPLNKALSLLQKIERQKQVSDAVDVLAEANAYVANAEVKQPDVKKAKIDSSAVADAEVVVKKCTHCNRKGHTIDECYQLKTCSFCGKKGHIQSICHWYKQTGALEAEVAILEKDLLEVVILVGM